MNYFKDEILRICVIIAMLAFWVMIFCVMKASADEIDDVLPFLIQAESGGNPNAVSKAGAIGLCQVTPIVLKEFNREGGHPDFYPRSITVSRLFEPEVNVYVAEWYLRRLRDHYLPRSIVMDRMEKTYSLGNISIGLNGREGEYGDTISCKTLPYLCEPQDVRIALILSAYNGGVTRLKSVNYDINKMPKETRDYVKKIMKLYKENNEKSR